MDAVENPVLEPRSERIARYKAERRRELAERYGNVEELPPSKWVRRDGRAGHDTTEPNQTHRATWDDSDGDRVNGRTRDVSNGVNADNDAGSRWSQDCANTLSGQLHTRVSVGQLRSVLLQQTGSGAHPDRVPEASSSLDLAVASGSEGGRRRTRRYLPDGGSGGSRKTCDRFRTQPITANEMEESGLCDGDEESCKADVKTDDRANMSVAAKMSLFKELEKTSSTEVSSLLKPRASSVCHERRSRRGNDHRFLTQPITCEEKVVVSGTKPCLPVESPSEPVEQPVEDADEGCRLSMSEKLALFNKLSLPGREDGVQPEAAPERRRQKGARYRTQPITVEEVNLLQKGPVQLPAFCLSSHLSDRQQASSVNLKPSELRLSQTKLDTEAEVGPGSGPGSEPSLRGILKKRSCSVSDGHEQNGGEAATQTRTETTETTETTERRERPAAMRRDRGGGEAASTTAAPWRQRARNRRETIACTPLRQETTSSGENNLDSTKRNSRQEEDETRMKIKDETSVTGRVQVTLVETSDSSFIQDAGGAAPQLWEPVFASVYSCSRQQYIMCFNQTSLSYEAQEVSSPSNNLVQPQWRHKVKAADEDEESEPVINTGSDSPQTSETRVAVTEFSHQSVTECEVLQSFVFSASQEETSALDGRFHSDRSPPSSCPAPHGGEAPPPDGERDLDVVCQTNTHILSSAVAEHRRSVRPSRRTQGSRNPLRALAARDDVRQDFMGERLNSPAEERNQTEKKKKNSSDDLSTSHPAFNSLMLIHVKGKHHVQVRVVEPSVRSLNSGDCFLLVTSEKCFLWSGEFANEEEKATAASLASFIQTNNDLGCAASQVVRLDEGLNPDDGDAEDFWRILGGRRQYRGAGSPEEDELFENGVVESNCVYRLVENKLVPQEQGWASIPSTSLLGSTQALVFDFGSEVYLWLGHDVSSSSRNVALQLSRQVWVGPYDYGNCRVNPLDPTQSNDVHVRGEGRPSWAVFGVVSEHNETSLFRHKFKDWTLNDDAAAENKETQSVSESVSAQTSESSDVLSPCDVKALVSSPSLGGDASLRNVLGGVDVQRGHGVITLEHGRRAELKTVAVDTWHVQEFDDSEVPVESTGQLHEGDSYVVRWTYNVSAVDTDSSDDCNKLKDNVVFFLWRGRHSAVTGRDTAAFLSIGMKNLENSQVVVHQGNEPPCFLQLFQGGLIVHKGKRDESSTNSAAAAWRLFCVRGELPEEASLLEVDCSCTSLRSRGCVVLLNSQQGALYLWTGCKAQGNVKEVGRRTVERLTHMFPPELGLSKNVPVMVQTVDEGSEPADFWSALGHMDRKAYDCMLQDPGKYNFTPRLFHLSVASGSFKAEELQSPSRLAGLVMAMPFVQESLYAAAQPALFLLDNRLEVYLWQRGQPEQTDGSASTWSRWHSERRSAMQTALQYCKEMNPRRPPQAYLIHEGSEPLTFTNVFPRWEKILRPNTPVHVGRVKLTLVQDALDQLMKTQFPVEELLRSPLPAGVDPQQLEVYLSDHDFQTLLEMKRDEFASLPSWKQIDLKKSKGLLC